MASNSYHYSERCHRTTWCILCLSSGEGNLCQSGSVNSRVGIRDGKLGWFREKCPMDLALSCIMHDATAVQPQPAAGAGPAGALHCMRALPPTAECDKLAMGGFGFDMTSGMRVEGVKRIIHYRSGRWIEKKNRELEVAHFWGRHILCCIGHYCYLHPFQLILGSRRVK